MELNKSFCARSLSLVNTMPLLSLTTVANLLANTPCSVKLRDSKCLRKSILELPRSVRASVADVTSPALISPITSAVSIPSENGIISSRKSPTAFRPPGLVDSSSPFNKSCLSL